ncbi:hypothetical protein EQO05_00170 [Methanosarcina sp. MSH10X1]|uniref:hypothetical protein n=1 Tax=Methanosarcina sp. MSH10X1 TaxID=2507075 RepID=UPI000FFB5AB8|nr:hypothetical protein [Methanosarcina sp. MSH10X1]RXA21710.1 hypothetical protein EQO05_00170 [Methanosarcina sp. MSH10X1]
MAENKKTRSRGERLKENEVKIGIIRYIISEDDKVSGPDITKYLLEKYNIVDENNIRNHLNDLKNQCCIEKIRRKPGLENKWKIEKMESLRSIWEHFPEIQLNTYDKSINIILEERDCKEYIFGPVHCKAFRIQLCLCDSLFNMCLEKGIKTVLDTAYKMFQYGEGYEEYDHILNDIRTFYNTYIEHISVSPTIWLDVYKENIDNISEVEVCSNSIIVLPNVKINEKTFREIFETTDLWGVDIGNWELKFVEEYAIKMADLMNQKMLHKINRGVYKRNYDLKVLSTYILEKFLADIPDDMSNIENYILLKELSVKISYEIFQTMFKEIPGEFLAIPDNICKVLIEVLVKVFRTVIQEMQGFPEKVQASPEEIRKIYQEYQEGLQEYQEDTQRSEEEFQEYQERYQEYLEGLMSEYEIELWEHRKKIEELIMGMNSILGEILAHQYTVRFSIYQVMFEHYFHRDIESGIDSEDERKYVIIMRRLQAGLKKNLVPSERDILALDRFCENYMEKRKEKSESPEIYTV